MHRNRNRVEIRIRTPLRLTCRSRVLIRPTRCSEATVAGKCERARSQGKRSGPFFFENSQLPFPDEDETPDLDHSVPAHLSDERSWGRGHSGLDKSPEKASGRCSENSEKGSQVPC